ncbi:unnamed protein product [Dibothriocephalus latus]|uniref:Uncharacterized protein n=1 Tax=Dibothriocephalus latus TaxID=60516 RepID=A0A3P7QDA5_DIBLA|nr:unnamed protein product [Dibothriocephalus latus]
MFVASFANLEGCPADDKVTVFDATLYVDVPSTMSKILMTSLTHLLCVILRRNKCPPADYLSSLILPVVGSERERLQIEPLCKFKTAGPSFETFLKEKSLQFLAALRLSYTTASGKTVLGVYGLLEAANATNAREVYRLAVDSEDASTTPENLGGIARLGQALAVIHDLIKELPPGTLCIVTSDNLLQFYAYGQCIKIRFPEKQLKLEDNIQTMVRKGTHLLHNFGSKRRDFVVQLEDLYQDVSQSFIRFFGSRGRLRHWWTGARAAIKNAVSPGASSDEEKDDEEEDDSFDERYHSEHTLSTHSLNSS